MTRTPLQTVPIQKKSKKLASEDLLLKKLGNARLAAGLHDSTQINTKSLPSRSFYNNQTEDVEAGTPASSVATSKEDQDKRCSLWEWRATQIGFFHKKRRYLNLKKRLDQVGTNKEIYPIDNEVFLKQPINKQFKGKKSKYNPREECFVTDISHRSKRVVLFRKRRHAKISGSVPDEMLRKVQVPVEASSNEPTISYYHDLTPFMAEKNKSFTDSVPIQDPPEAKNDSLINLNFLPIEVAEYELNEEDKSAWLRINTDFWNQKNVTRDENNKEVTEPAFVRLKKVNFAYILSLLETQTFKEIHNALLSVLNVPNQAEGDAAFCEICQSESSEAGDPIVFCDECDLSVHQHCFGIPEIPSGAWYCKVCEEYGSKTEVKCRYCPLSGGTMKKTVDGDWAHFACAVWQQSLRFDDLSVYEPISHEWDLKPESFSKICSVCDISYGSCIKCSVRNCGIPFHPTCGLRGGLLMFVEDNDNAKNGYKMFSFCFYHSDKAKEVQKVNSGQVGIEFILEQLDHDGSNANIESYKMSQLSKLEKHFERFVNWRALPVQLNIDKDLLYTIYDFWVQRRKRHNNRPLVNPFEINELFIKGRFKVERSPKKSRKSKESVSETDNPDLVQDFAAAHMKLDRCRNLCTLSMRREKLKWQMVVSLKEAFEQVLGNLGDETTHFSSRSIEKLTQFWSDYMGLEPEPAAPSPKPSPSKSPKSPSKSKMSGNKIQNLFADLFQSHPSLPPSLFDELPEDCL